MNIVKSFSIRILFRTGLAFLECSVSRVIQKVKNEALPMVIAILLKILKRAFN